MDVAPSAAPQTALASDVEPRLFAGDALRRAAATCSVDGAVGATAMPCAAAAVTSSAVSSTVPGAPSAGVAPGRCAARDIHSRAGVAQRQRNALSGPTTGARQRPPPFPSASSQAPPNKVPRFRGSEVPRFSTFLVLVLGSWFLVLVLSSSSWSFVLRSVLHSSFFVLSSSLVFNSHLPPGFGVEGTGALAVGGFHVPAEIRRGAVDVGDAVFLASAHDP